MYKLLLYVVVLFIFGCATTSVKDVDAYKRLLQERKYTEALQYAKKETFFSGEHSKLLKLLEYGTVHHLMGEYYQSLKYFDEAQELSDRLYTVSISKKAKSFVTNDASDNYYGERYERSLIRFYQALNHYLIFQNGTYESFEKKIDDTKTEKVPEKILTDTERRTHLFAARASILNWASTLETYRQETSGETVYKDDLLAKIFGAFIHEQIGSGPDRQIALQLYRDAQKILFRNYNTYAVFNGKHKKFRSDFKKFPSMNTKDVEEKYVSQTTFAKELSTFLDAKIKDLEGRKKNNVNIVIQQGLVASKRPRKIDFPLEIATRTSSIVRGQMSMVDFTVHVLSVAKGTRPSITFELPEIEKKGTVFSMSLLVKQGEKLVKEVPVVIVDPVSEIAYEALDEQIGLTYSKIGARVAAKHAAAIASSYLVYKTALKNGSPSFAAQMMGTLAYAAKNKVIAASEQADLRHWNSLPHNFRFASFSLPTGEYQLELKQVDGAGAPMVRTLSPIKVESDQKTMLMNIRL